MTNQRKCKNWLRVAAAFLAVTLPVSELSAELSVLNTPFRENVTAASLDNLVLPNSIGTIKEIYHGHSHAFVVHIQDAHGNVSAQQSIFEIVRYLHEQFGIGLVAVEGASGGQDLSPARNFPDVNIRDRVANIFFKKGRLTGEEYYLIRNNPKGLSLVGIEDRSFYKVNLEQFVRNQRARERLEPQLKRFRVAVCNMVNQNLSEDLKRLIRKRNAFLGRQSSVEEYLVWLYNSLQLEFKDDPALHWPVLSQFHAVLEATEPVQREPENDLDAKQLLEDVERAYRFLAARWVATEKERTVFLLNRWGEVLHTLFDLEMTGENLIQREFPACTRRG